MRKTLRALSAATLTTGLVVAGASIASAHVTITPDTTTAGSYGLLTVSVPHGCDASSTTEVSVQMPEQIVAVTPSVNPGWDVEKVMEDLDSPVADGHGGEYTERVSEVVYTAKTPLPDGYRDAFVLSLKIPDVAGDTLVFPTVQTCEEGESAWVEVPAEGQSEEELDLPAPMFEVTAAEAEGDAAATDEEATADEETADVAEADAEEPAADGTAVASSDDAGTPAATWVALALGAAGLVLGLVAFLRTRRTQG